MTDHVVCHCADCEASRRVAETGSKWVFRFIFLAALAYGGCMVVSLAMGG